MPAGHPVLTAGEVIAGGGWHPRYARVLAIASDGDYGFALVDGNGDDAELEAELWRWDGGSWAGAGSSGAGPLATLELLLAADHADSTCYAYGSAPGYRAIALSFEGQRHEAPVSQHGTWAFVKVRTDPHSRELPTLA